MSVDEADVLQVACGDAVADMAFRSLIPAQPTNSLQAQAAMRILYQVKGWQLRWAISFMGSAGTAPDRITISLTQDARYVVMFVLKCSTEPFVARYTKLDLLLQSLRCLFSWHIRLVEFFNVAFDIRDIPTLAEVIEGLSPELVLLRNCTYPEIDPGHESIQFLNAINRQKKTIVCEYGEDRLKGRIGHEVPMRSDEELLDIMPKTIPRVVPDIPDLNELMCEGGEVSEVVVSTEPEPLPEFSLFGMPGMRPPPFKRRAQRRPHEFDPSDDDDAPPAVLQARAERARQLGLSTMGMSLAKLPPRLLLRRGMQVGLPLPLPGPPFAKYQRYRNPNYHSDDDGPGPSRPRSAH